MSSTFRRLALGASKPKFLVSVAASGHARCLFRRHRALCRKSLGFRSGLYGLGAEARRSRRPPQSDEIISSRPLANASVKPPAYDYSKSYQAPQYKQPAFAKAPAVSTSDVETPQVETSRLRRLLLAARSLWDRA